MRIIRHITFPLTILIVKPYSWLLALFLCALLILLYIYPETPAQLTLYDNNQQVYLSRCPELSPVVQPAGRTIKYLSLPFSLLNWNIYKQQKTQWQEKLQQWAEQTHLLTLQEVKYSPEFKDFSQINTLYYFQNSAFKYRGFTYGVNTLSKYSTLFVCGTRDKEPWIRVAKTGLATLYPIADLPATLLLINLHGVNFTLTALPLHKQIQPYLKLIDKHQGPVIFSGDFNTWSAARLAAIEEPLHSAGFKEVKFQNDQRIRRFAIALDHIYFRGLKVIKAASIKTEASDHSPQLVTFDIN